MSANFNEFCEQMLDFPVESGYDPDWLFKLPLPVRSFVHLVISLYKEPTFFELLAVILVAAQLAAFTVFAVRLVKMILNRIREA